MSESLRDVASTFRLPQPVTTSAVRPPGRDAGAQEAAKPTARARLDHVDAVRPVKQLGVVTTHSLIAVAPAASAAAGGAIMLLHVSREAFFFVSACMLTYANPDPARIAWGRFARRRAMSVALPYLCWTVIYWVGRVTLPLASPGQQLHRLIHLLLTGYYQLYYLLVIAQFYVLFPLLLLLVRATRRHPVALLVASAVVQGTYTGVMHWNLLPPGLEGWWATREILPYQFYLVGGCLAAFHLRDFEQWLGAHTRAVLIGTLVSAGVAVGWYLLAVDGTVAWLGAANDAFQPIVLPFNVGAILSLYVLGRTMVDGRRSVRFRQWVRRGSDNSYGVFLSHTLIIGFLLDASWDRLTTHVPWPFLLAVTVVFTYSSSWMLTSVLARTRFSEALTGRRRVRRGEVVVPMGPSVR